MDSLRVADVRLRRGSSSDVMTGLLGYVELTLNGGLRLTGIALRRTRGGELRLSFPARRDRTGQDHPVVYPLDAETRRVVESQVLEALGLNQEGAA